MGETIRENLKLILIGESGLAKKSRKNIDCKQTDKQRI